MLDKKLVGKTFKINRLTIVLIFLFIELGYTFFIFYNAFPEIIPIIVLTFPVILFSFLVLIEFLRFKKIIIDDCNLIFDAFLKRSVIPIDYFEDANVALWSRCNISILIKTNRIWVSVNKKTKEGLIRIITLSKKMSRAEKEKLFNSIEWICNNVYFNNNID